jgi:hypothetical protein
MTTEELLSGDTRGIKRTTTKVVTPSSWNIGHCERPSTRIARGSALVFGGDEGIIACVGALSRRRGLAHGGVGGGGHREVRELLCSAVDDLWMFCAFALVSPLMRSGENFDLWLGWNVRGLYLIFSRGGCREARELCRGDVFALHFGVVSVRVGWRLEIWALGERDGRSFWRKTDYFFVFAFLPISKFWRKTDYSFVFAFLPISKFGVSFVFLEVERDKAGGTVPWFDLEYDAPFFLQAAQVSTWSVDCVFVSYKYSEPVALRIIEEQSDGNSRCPAPGSYSKHGVCSRIGPRRNK